MHTILEIAADVLSRRKGGMEHLTVEEGLAIGVLNQYNTLEEAYKLLKQVDRDHSYVAKEIREWLDKYEKDNENCHPCHERCKHRPEGM